VKTNDTSVDNLKVSLLDAKMEDTRPSNHVEISNPLVNCDDVEEATTTETTTILLRNDDGGATKVTATRTYEEAEKDFFDEWSENSKRLFGIFCAICAGVFFGCSFDPSQYVIDNHYDGNDDALNYVFAHYTGILITSWFYTIAYCCYKNYNNLKPFIPSDCILPGTLSGIMWGIAQIGWFYANGQLGFAITFPFASSGPGFIGSLWGIFLFKEITGTKNLMILGLAFLITVVALIMVVLSH
jgi:hypothetical protein